MIWRRTAVLTATVLALAGVGLLSANEEKSPAQKTRDSRLEALAVKLGLSDQQRLEIHKIHTDFSKKTGPLKHQLEALRHDKREAIGKVLTEEQRARLHDVLRTARETKWQATAAKLNLSDEQKQRVEKVRQEYARRFQDLAEKKRDNRRDQFRALRKEKYQAIGRELTEEQRAKLWDLARKEHHQRRDPAARAAFWKGVGEKLDVSPEQREQIKKIRAAHAVQMEKPAARLKELRRDEHAAIAKVLTEEQRVKLRELWQSKHPGKEKPAVNGKE